MKSFPFVDKSITFMLARKNITHENGLKFEQNSFFIINRFAEGIKSKSKEELVLLNARLIKDVDAYPRRAYFFKSLLQVVIKQLKKFD